MVFLIDNSAKPLKDASGCLLKIQMWGAVLCSVFKFKASWSVTCPGVICEGLIPKTAMATE